MSTHERPLSPHLQIYRPQLTSVLSISHRISGVLLSIGLVPLVVWILALSAGPEQFEAIKQLYSSPLAVLFWVAWSFSLFYHFCNGIRHLLWDAGYLLDIKSAYASGWTVVAVALLMTAAGWGIWL